MMSCRSIAALLGSLILVVFPNFIAGSSVAGIQEIRFSSIQEAHARIVEELDSGGGLEKLITSKCIACNLLIIGARHISDMNTTWDVDFAVRVCDVLFQQEHSVCKAMVQSLAPEVLEVIAKRVDDPARFCCQLGACSFGCGQVRSRCSDSVKIPWPVPPPEESSEDAPPEPDMPEVGLGAPSVASAMVPTERAVVHTIRRMLPRATRNEAGDGDKLFYLASRYLGRIFGWEFTSTSDASDNSNQLGKGRGQDGADGQGRSAQVNKRDDGSAAAASALRGDGVGHFLHISDIHLDLNYTEGSNAVCGKPICCHTTDGVPASSKDAAGRLGSYRCDTPPTLLLDVLQQAQRLHPEGLDFIVNTGDLVAHTVWKDTRVNHLATMRWVHQAVHAAFPSVPMYSVLGNHETVPVDQFLANTTSSNWLLEHAWRQWSRWLPSEAKSTVLRGGYYTVLHRAGMRIVGINTQFCDNMNFWLQYADQAQGKDPAGQLAWLQGVLAAAEAAGERVLILGHIPPGCITCYVLYAREYGGIVHRFHDTIMGQLFGHTHSDHFHMWYDPDTLTEPESVAFMGPSVTSYLDRNPSFRVWEFAPPAHDPPLEGAAPAGPVKAQRAASLVDYSQYMLNLKHLNDIDNNKTGEDTGGLTAGWILQYSALDAYGPYGITSMEPESWARFADNLAKSRKLFDEYYMNLVSRHLVAPYSSGAMDPVVAPKLLDVCPLDCWKAWACRAHSQTYSLSRKCWGGNLRSWDDFVGSALDELMGC